MKVIEDCDTLYEYRQQFSEWHFDAWQPDAPYMFCLLYTSPSPRDRQKSRMPSSA